MKNILFSILFAMFAISSFGQTSITGVILGENSQPIPFAHIISSDSSYGTISTIDGRFVVPSNVYDSVFTISAIGYEVFNLTVNHKDLAQTIKLTPKSYHLKEFSITSTKYKRRWLNDFRNPSFGSFSWVYGGEYATFVDESERYDSAHLIKVSVFIRNLSKNNYVRIHVYANNLLCSCPGEELLDSNYVIGGDKIDTWVEIDVSNSRVEIPENGVFISVEGFCVDEECNTENLYIGAFSKPFRFGNHTFHKTLVGNWKKSGSKPTFKVANVLNLAVKVELAYDKKQVQEARNIAKSDLKYEEYSKRQIKKLFGTKKVVSSTDYPNDSFENLINSIYRALENEDIPYLVNNLFVFDKESKESVFYEVQRRKEHDHWFPKNEKEKVLAYWKTILNNIENAEFTKVDTDKFHVKFSDAENTELYVQTDGQEWRMYSNYSTGVRK